jgi:hypothetical protein
LQEERIRQISLVSVEKPAAMPLLLKLPRRLRVDTQRAIPLWEWLFDFLAFATGLPWPHSKGGSVFYFPLLIWQKFRRFCPLWGRSMAFSLAWNLLWSVKFSPTGSSLALYSIAIYVPFRVGRRFNKIPMSREKTVWITEEWWM